MQSFFTKKVSPYFAEGEETLCFMFISFSISKSFIPNFLWYRLWPFKWNYLAIYFKIIQFSFEIFQTVLSLKCKII